MKKLFFACIIFCDVFTMQSNQLSDNMTQKIENVYYVTEPLFRIQENDPFFQEALTEAARLQVVTIELVEELFPEVVALAQGGDAIEK